METQTQKAERKHPDKKPRVLHFTTRLSTCQPKIYNIDRRARRQDATRTKQCDQDSITIPRFISHCRLQGFRIGQSEPGPKLPAAPPWIYKGDRDPISRPSLSSLSLSLLEVGARVCVNRVAARLARERAQARFPWSHCRRPAKEAASLIGIPTRSLLLSPPLCVVGRVGPSALFYDRVYAMWTNWSDGAKIFHKDFLFLFFLSRGKGGKEEKWRTIFDNYEEWNF